jgi:ATP-binding cassette, subfamily B, bacterial
VSVGSDAGKIRCGLAALRPHARGEGWSLAAGVALGIAAVAFHIVRPWPLKWILDALTGAHEHAPIVRWARDAGTPGVLALSALYVALTILFGAATYGQVMLLNGVGNRVLFRFRTALFTHLLRQPLAFHESHDVGELLTRVVYDTSRLRRGLNGLAVKMGQTLFLFLGTLAVLFWLAPALGAVLAIGGVAAFHAMHRRGRRIVRAAKRQRKKEGAIASMVADELHGVRELQTFGPEASAAQRRFAKKNDSSLLGEQKVRRLAAGIAVRVEVLFALTIALTLWLGTRAALDGHFTAGDLVLFLSYALSLRGPFEQFAKQTARVGRTAACASRLVKLMARDPALTDAPDAIAAGRLRGDLAFEGVSLKTPSRGRGTRKWAIDDLWCRFPAGARTAIVGGNGAGKSTLLRVALRLAAPSAGRVLVDGRDAREYQAASLRAQMSVVFQDSVLFGLSVRDNIALGMPAASDAAVADAACRAHAAEIIERLPLGYGTPVRRRGGLFSPGERQRLAIARALLRDGRVWLLDEPTTGLDQEGAEELTDLLLAATAGRTTLWVTHDPALAARLDRVVALDAARLAFAGTAEEYAAWYGARRSTVRPMQRLAMRTPMMEES